MKDMIEKFKEAMLQHGLEIHSEIIANNTLQRFHVNGDKQCSRNGWYILQNTHDIAFGAFGCWKRDIKQTWCSKNTSTMTRREKRIYRQHLNQQRDCVTRAQELRYEEVARMCRKIWDTAVVPESHFPYLIKKQISEITGLRFYKNTLIVPVYNDQDVMVSLQCIQSDGSKRFYPGGRIQGCFSQIGEPTETIYLCEGYATAWSIHQASQCQVVIAFHVGNLQVVAAILKQKYPDKTIVIAADNDRKRQNNVGLDKAKAIAKQLNMPYVYPEFSVNDSGSDFNDLMCLYGLEVVKKALCALHTEKPQRLMARIKSIDLFDGDGKKNVATLLIEIGLLFELFHDENDDGYACVQDGNDRGVYEIGSQALSQKLSYCYFLLSDRGVGAAALNEAVDTLKAKAIYQHPKCKVYRRVAKINHVIYIDLGHKDSQVIEIAKTGWRVVTNTSIYFIQSRYAQSLPHPSHDGDIQLLWKYLNVAEEDRVLVWGYILGCFNPSPPYPILWLHGAQGSGKSSATKILKRIIDPNTGETTALPKDERDLIVYAKNNHLICFDNNSHIDNDLSDQLCRIASGAAISMRQLYTNANELVYRIARPMIINGISNNINRADLLERTIAIELLPFESQTRKTEATIYAEFKQDLPKILGAICDDLSHALVNQDHVGCHELPRMADFAKWVMAAEISSEMFRSGQFIERYRQCLSDSAFSDALENPVVVAIQTLLEQSVAQGASMFECTSSVLLRTINELDVIPEVTKRTNSWPKNPKSLGRALERLSPQLRLLGIEIKKRKSNGVRLIEVYKKVLPEKNDLKDPSLANPIIKNEKNIFSGRGIQDIRNPGRVIAFDERGIRFISKNLKRSFKFNLNQ